MTTEKAISIILNDIKVDTIEQGVACNMAIQALETLKTQPCEEMNNVTDNKFFNFDSPMVKNSEDAISRQYLIEKIGNDDGLEGLENSNLFAKHYMNIVKAAPSVKTLDPYDDYVSREAVELYIKGYIHEIITESGTDKNEHTNSVLRAILNGIKTMPSVTPKQKTGQGHWITEAQTYYEELKKRGLGVDEYTPYFTDDIACSECLAKYSTLDNETQFFKHCPNCGAKMEESEEEE